MPHIPECSDWEQGWDDLAGLIDAQIEDEIWSATVGKQVEPTDDDVDAIVSPLL